MEAGLSWTDDRVALLRRLWEDGQSASKIAAQLGGVTRNAVIGKVHRLGLAGRARGVEEAPAVTPAATAVEIETALAVVETQAPEPVAILSHRPAPTFPVPAPTPEPVALSVSERVTIMDLREAMCRWPLGDPTTPEFRFCGARSITGLPYCTHHAEIAYQPAAERKRDRRVASFR
ncbi:GcrA family cell cycle regulator [Methylobacterium sp. NEAU K]|uniref:GcrA family cell cycle regulator n=1 Tax=Methylobacterium sp. NEAU K TaxID=3064946 RepID=UPI002733DFAA|nr:GcrA family cell cycle regulator [Methylobacterium sp. NEAU K]MDP4004969.1 GcrA family cell cycle regulator [Methylobacterium sp. NEAU K]